MRKLSLVDNVKELQTHMLGVGVSDETSLKCFKPEHAMLTVEYITSALFQHYNLFEFLFTEQQETEILHSNVCHLLIAYCIFSGTASVSMWLCTVLHSHLLN